MSLSPASGALNQAMSQLDRLAHAPDPGHAPVDGRSLASLLAFAAEYGKLIQFYDLADAPDGDWSAFFRGDQSVALALLAALDLADIERQIDLLLDALRHVIGVEQRLRLWQDLSGSTTRLLAIARRAGVPHGGLLPALAEVPAWRSPGPLLEPAARLARHFGGETAEARLQREPQGGGWLQELLALLEEFFASLLLALQQERDAAVAALPASLLDKRHAPQSGLWDAFAQLFRHAQHSVNRFPRRLLDFYQEQVLRQRTRAETPDQLVLAFTPADGVSQTSLAKGTPFLAGTDNDGLPILYGLDAALTVSAASVTALRTVTLAPCGDPAAPAGRLVLGGEVALSDTPPAIPAAFPLFGADQPGLHGALLSQEASLGFAIASDCLLLAGGLREIKLELYLQPTAAQAPASLPPADLARLLGIAFALRYTTPDGWADIHGYRVAPPTQPDGPYLLSFQLDADAAPWAADPAQAALPWGGLPTLSARLLQSPPPAPGEARAYPYAALSALSLSALALRVAVSGLEQLQISGPGGPLDAGAPFALFGSPPVQHAALSISAPELFVKRLDCFSVTITWFGLPVASSGFKGYYEGYVIDADGNTCAPGLLFNNRIFTAGLEVVNPGSWTLRSGPPFQRLFQLGVAQIEPAPLLPRTALREPVIAKSAERYYDPQLSAVRLRLEEPSYAFGDVLYAPNVMAASLQLTAIAASCAGLCTPPPVGDGDAPLEPVLRACQEGDDASFPARVSVAVQQSLGSLDGQALAALDAAIGQAVAIAEQPAWRDGLRAALRQQAAGASLLQRLRRLRAPAQDGPAVHAGLRQWLAAHGAALQAGGATARVAQAHAALAAGDALLSAWQASIGPPTPVARPELAGSMRQLQDSLRAVPTDTDPDCIRKCMHDAVKPAFPNQPWLPMAQGIQVSYGAAAAQPPVAGQAGATALHFFHLCPFDRIEAAGWQDGQAVPLLAPLAGAGTLDITLSAPATELSLLFQMAPPPGGWPMDTAMPYWQQGDGTAWQALTPQSDTTNGLRQSGIVRFALAPWPAGAPLRLRAAYAEGDAARYPLLAGLLGNAASATWLGPGGAGTLGTPLPAGSISAPAAPLPEIGSIVQPEASFGGRARASGAAFDLWQAERLRHKDYGIQAWDYASLVLAAFPSLWQAGVVAASNGAPGCAPGQVWLVAVPGPATPAIDDPTVPGCTAQALSQIAAYLAPRISPFIELHVSNPPYVRLCVHANLRFADDDKTACLRRLNEELVAYLSPWPTPALGARAANYYTWQEVARFIRQRPYVKAILALRLSPDPGRAGAPPAYYTSALSHALVADAPHGCELLRQPAIAPPREAA